jgi:hypothetical protein
MKLYWTKDKDKDGNSTTYIQDGWTEGPYKGDNPATIFKKSDGYVWAAVNDELVYEGYSVRDAKKTVLKILKENNMNKFNELHTKILNEMERDYLTIAQVMKVADDVIRSEGLQSWFNGDSMGYNKIADSKMELLTSAILTAFQTAMIHHKLRDDLKTHGYEWLVTIADNHNLWQQGQNYGLQNI